MTETDGPRACPFAGCRSRSVRTYDSSVQLEGGRDVKGVAVHCLECGASGPLRTTSFGARTAWNALTPLPRRARAET